MRTKLEMEWGGQMAEGEVWVEEAGTESGGQFWEVSGRTEVVELVGVEGRMEMGLERGEMKYVVKMEWVVRQRVVFSFGEGVEKRRGSGGASPLGTPTRPARSSRRGKGGQGPRCRG